MMASLNFFFLGSCHVVAQVVETKFVVRAIRNVCCIVTSFFGRRSSHTRDNKSNLETHPTMNATHPLSMESGQVIVHRDDVHAFSRERIEICRQRRDKSFAFTGSHFWNPASMQCGPTHQLNIKMSLANYSQRRLAHYRESFNHEIVNIFPALYALAELDGLGLQGLI